MAIRIRTINNRVVAICAASTRAQEGDVYLDDAMHHALTHKFEAYFKLMGFWKEEEEKGPFKRGYTCGGIGRLKYAYYVFVDKWEYVDCGGCPECR